MQDIFSKLPPGTLSTQNNPNAGNVAKQIEVNLARAKEYQSKPEWYIRNEHVLVRMLKTMQSPSTVSPIDIYFNGVDLISSIDGVMGILSDTNQRMLDHKGNFYSDAVSEYMFDFRNNIGIASFNQMLFKTPAVKVFYHPYTSMDFKPLDGDVTYSPSLTPYCVIGIDIALLYTQYHVWLDQNKGEIDGASANRFLFSQVISKMLDSHLEQAIANRFIAYYTGNPTLLSNVVSRTPYPITDMHKQVDELLVAQVDAVRRSKADFYTVLSSVPIVSKSLLEVSRMPSMPRLRQLRWIGIVGRLELIGALCINDTTGVTGKNSNAIGYWKEQMKVMSNDVIVDLPKAPLLDRRLKEVQDIIVNGTRIDQTVPAVI